MIPGFVDRFDGEEKKKGESGTSLSILAQVVRRWWCVITQEGV